MTADQLRKLGLPLVLEPAVRARHLLARTAPLLAFLALLFLGLAAFNRANTVADLYFDQLGAEGQSLQFDEALVRLVLVGTALLLAAPLLGWLVGLVLRRVGSRIADVVGAVLGVVLVIGPVVAFGRDGGIPLWVTGGSLLALIAATYFGVGTIVRWSGRRVLRELSTLAPMVARVLPVLMIAFLFFFYNAEIWQVMVALSWSRTRWVVVLMGVFAVVLTVMTTRDELRSVLADHASERAQNESGAPPLRRGEKVNLLLIPCLVVLIQSALFAVVVFAFFVLFGWLSVSEATAAQWTGQPARRFEGLLARVPISPTLVKVSMALAAFAALNFAASAGADRQHRERYVEPLLDEIVHSLHVRDDYVTRRRDAD